MKTAMSRAAALVVTIAAVSVPSAAQANQPPEITNASVSPTSLPRVGGKVEVTSQITDNEGGPVSYVYITARGPYTFDTLATNDGGGTVDIPFNLTPEPVDWDLTITARDLDNAETTVYAGRVRVAPGHGFDEAPLASNPFVSPTTLTAAGGPVQLGLTATDDSSIAQAYADVIDASFNTTRVPLDAKGNDRFEGVYNAPANTGSTANQYRVQLVAIDDIGQVGAVDGSPITVAAPAPAPAARLRILPGSVEFGAVRVGERRRRFVLVQNVAPRSSGPVEAKITTSGAPFALPGAPDGRTFRLRAGETKAFPVEYAPVAAGVQRGTVSVGRTDGAQAPASARLSGKGVARRATAGG